MAAKEAAQRASSRGSVPRRRCPRIAAPFRGTAVRLHRPSLRARRGWWFGGRGRVLPPGPCGEIRPPSLRGSGEAVEHRILRGSKDWKRRPPPGPARKIPLERITSAPGRPERQGWLPRASVRERPAGVPKRRKGLGWFGADRPPNGARVLFAGPPSPPRRLRVAPDPQVGGRGDEKSPSAIACRSRQRLHEASGRVLLPGHGAEDPVLCPGASCFITAPNAKATTFCGICGACAKYRGTPNMWVRGVITCKPGRLGPYELESPREAQRHGGEKNLGRIGSASFFRVSVPLCLRASVSPCLCASVPLVV